MTLPNGFALQCVELPWRDNKSSLSCIPAGVYRVVPWNSKKFGRCWHVTGVDGRTAILIHKGNVAGNKEEGYKTHSSGCIIIGYSRGTLYGQKAVLNSGKAMSLAHKHLDHLKEFELIIEDYEDYGLVN